MKKTLLATAIAASMAATGAQAATVYDQDGTKLDVYGRIAMGIKGGGPESATYTAPDGTEYSATVNNDAEFVDMYSRLGLRMSQEINSDLTAFGRVEWRFNGDGGDGRFAGFKETRQSYIGVRSGSWGTLQAGNFDAFYNQAVSITFDKYIDQGLEFAGHPTQSRGDSIGYITPNLEGFQVYLQGKHYSERGNFESATVDGQTVNLDQTGEDNVIATQGGAVYEIDNLRLAAGWVEDVKRGGGNGENIYGATASYEFMPGFSGRLGYETRDSQSDSIKDGYDTVGLGMSYAQNAWTVHADVYDVNNDDNDDRTAWALGGYYDVSSNFQTFVELYQGDQESVTVDIGGGDVVSAESDSEDMYYLVGARYFF